MGERSCAPLGMEMPATLAELWNRALMSRASASPTTASASPRDALQDCPVDNEDLQAEVAALLTEEGENAVLSELLGEMSPGYAHSSILSPTPSLAHAPQSAPPPTPVFEGHSTCSPARRFAIETREPEYEMPGAVAVRHFETKKKRRRGSPRQHRTNSDVSISSTTSEASGVHCMHAPWWGGVARWRGWGVTWRLNAHLPLPRALQSHLLPPPPTPPPHSSHPPPHGYPPPLPSPPAWLGVS